MDQSFPICGQCGKPHVTRFNTKSCKAHSKRDKSKPCPNPPVAGKDVCRMHGGRSLSGAAHPRWKGGIATSLPIKMRQMFDERAADPDLISVRHCLAMLTVRMEVLNGLFWDEEGGGSLWLLLKDHWSEFQTSLRMASDASKAGDEAGVEAAREMQAGAMTSISRIISAGSKDESIWAELRELYQEATRLAAAEIRIIKEKGAFITDAEMPGLIEMMHRAAVTAVDKIPDDRLRRTVLNDLGLELQRLLLGQAGEKRQAVAAEITGGTGPVVDVAVVAKDQPVAADQQQPAD